MALELQRDLPNGTSGNYWSICQMNITDTVTKVYLTLHVSKEAKMNGATPLVETSKIVNHSKEDVMYNNIYAFMYVEIKKSGDLDGIEMNEFSAAKDV